MLPGDTPRGNLLPIVRFAGHGLIVAALGTHVAWTAYKAPTHPPLSAYRPSQLLLRGRNATAFSVLAFLSLASVSVFAFRWRALSYMNWARLHDHKMPHSLWSGWSGAANDTVGHWQTSICVVKLMPFPFSLQRDFSTRPSTSLASSSPPYSLVSKVDVSQCRTTLLADPFPSPKTKYTYNCHSISCLARLSRQSRLCSESLFRHHTLHASRRAPCDLIFARFSLSSPPRSLLLSFGSVCLHPGLPTWRSEKR
jgi:hypothetical protein